MVDVATPDHYGVLGLERTATVAQVKTAYKKKALQFHPDKAKDKANAADQFHKISQAYETLVDDEKRRKYEDSWRLSQLRADLNERRRGAAPPPSAYGGSPMHSRGPSADMRSPYPPRSPYAGAAPFSSGSRVFETRAPRNRSPDDDYESRYDDSRYGAKKSAQEFRRSTPPPKPSRTSSYRQEDIRRPREEPKAKYAFDSKKQTRARDNDRYAKQYRPRSPSSSVSSSSGDDYSTRGRDEDEVRRSRAPPRQRASPPNDPHMNSKVNDAQEYMARARRGYSPPHSPEPHPSRAYMRAAFQSDVPPRPTAEPRRDSYDTRPPMPRRTTSTRQGPAEPIPRTRAGSIRGDSPPSKSSRGPEDVRRPGPPPTLNHSVSSPPGGGNLPKMAEQSRRATAPTWDSQPPPPRGGVPRSNTMPTFDKVKQQDDAPPPRRHSEAHQGSQPPRPTMRHGSSGLREGMTATNAQEDSGYSTGNSPAEESPKKENLPQSFKSPPTATNKSTWTYNPSKPASSTPRRPPARDESDTDSSDDTDSDDNSTVKPPPRTTPRPNPNLRTPAPAPESRSQSPLRREVRQEEKKETRANEGRSRTNSNAAQHAPHTHTAERSKGPPPSSSAKYAYKEKEKVKDSKDPYRPDNYPDTSTSQAESRPTRRPSLSTRSTSYSKAPGLKRSETDPVRPKLDTRHTAKDIPRAPQFGEGGYGTVFTASPVDYTDRAHKSGDEGRDSGRERERESSRYHKSGDEGKDSGRDSGREERRERKREKESSSKEKSSKSGRDYRDMWQSANATIMRDRERSGGFMRASPRRAHTGRS